MNPESPLFQDEYPTAYYYAVEAYKHRKAWLSAKETVARKTGNGSAAATNQALEEVSALNGVVSREHKEFIDYEADAIKHMPEIPAEE